MDRRAFLTALLAAPAAALRPLRTPRGTGGLFNPVADLHGQYVRSRLAMFYRIEGEFTSQEFRPSGLAFAWKEKIGEQILLEPPLRPVPYPPQFPPQCFVMEWSPIPVPPLEPGDFVTFA